MFLRAPEVILQKILSFLLLDDISIVVTLCKYTKSIKSQIYASALFANITNEFNVKTIVENCPRIKYMVVSTGRIDSTHLELLHKLNLETLYIEENISFVKLSFKNLKKLGVVNMEDYDTKDCALLEHICVKNITTKINKSKFPNLKSVKISGGGSYQLDLPITDLWTASRITPDVIKLPLHTLYISELQTSEANTTFSLIEKSNIKTLRVGSRLEFNVSGNYPKLVSLILKRGILKNVSAPNLRKLELAQVKVNIQILLKMTNLDDLCLDNCIYNYSEFGLISKLPITNLVLLNCRVNLDTIAKMKLKSLRLIDCIVEGDLDNLPKTLQILSLVGLYIDKLPYLDKLQTLKISSPYVDNKEVMSEGVLQTISRMPITNLTLTGCMLNDTHMDCLVNMPLNFLDIQRNNITIVGIRKLRRLPLRRLEVSDIPILHALQC